MKQINLYLIMMLIMFILVVVMILVSVAFLTLMERKLLSYMQIRKGPNKISFMGILQPFSDAIKLMSKESNLVNKSNYLFYYSAPILSLILIMMMWMIYPFFYNYLVMLLGLMYLMCCFSLGVYSLLFSGWSSNSSYSMLGALRTLAQSISYEVSLSMILIIPMFMINSMNFVNLSFYQYNIWMMFYMFPMGIMFFFSIMAELNRTPFDFSEGESELVSGFNIEYGSVGFTLIFLSEYASILFLSYFFSLIYLGGNYMKLLFYIKMMMMVFLVIWIRGSFPRFRYDLLMYMCWLMILPLTLNYMFYMIIFKIYIYK